MDPFRLPRLELYAVLFYVKEREGILRDRKKNVMSWLDWILVFIPLVVVAVIGLRSQKYVHTVADFLAAGRVAGRYVICVANGEAAMGLISLVSVWEIYYNSGLAFSFWSALLTPVVVIMGLTGYCFYRFRETRAMTMGQFLEMRYNRSFRILAAFLQSISGVVNYAIFPAVGARCLIYFIGLPLHFSVFGVRIATFPLLIFLCLAVAVWIVTMGGQVTIMVTDCVQGLVSYPMYAIIVIYLACRLSWDTEVIPALMDRPEGMSMINPYDISRLRNFNLFFVIAGIVTALFDRMAWSGTQGYNAAAENAHEQKMGALLGTWRSCFDNMMYVLLAVAAFAFMHHAHFRAGADRARRELVVKAVEESAPGERFAAVREEIRLLATEGVATEGVREALRQYNREAEAEAQQDTHALERRFDAEAASPVPPERLPEAAKAVLAQVDRRAAQTAGTLCHQLAVPMALREFLPVGIMGLLCALMVFLMVSTDTTYLHSWGSIIVQDIVLPLRGRPFRPRTQMNLLRVAIGGVAAFAFAFSSFFSQMDFIAMFFAITGAIWISGAGPVIVMGLYWRRGTTAGAFASLLFGSIFSVAGLIAQHMWGSHIYPALAARGWAEPLGRFLWRLSSPFHPYVQWTVTPNQFPINSTEMAFLTLVFSLLLYVVVSLLTCRRPYDMEKLLHRGKYADGPAPAKIPWTPRTVLGKLIGIDGNYTRGDKVLAWGVFLWSFVFQFLVCFVLIVVWNHFYKWPEAWWGTQFKIVQFIVPGVVGLVSTVWFTWGGTRDLKRLFRRLREKKDDFHDDGLVQKDTSHLSQQSHESHSRGL